MAIAFAIGRHMHQLGAGPPAGRRRLGAEAPHQAVGEVVAAVQKPVEGDGPRARAVVEKHRDAAPGFQLHQVGARGVDAGVGRLLPADRRRGFGRLVAIGFELELRLVGQRTHPRALARRKHREQNAVLRQQLQRLAVHRRLRQPHAFRLAPEARLEIGDAPANLRRPVAGRGQRHDHVVVNLRHRRPVAAEAKLAPPVRFEDMVIRALRVLFEPGEQRRTEVEADPRVVVDDADDLVFRVHDPRCPVRRIAFGGDALVPIVIRRSGILGLHRLQPGVLARRLVKMSVNGDETFGTRSWGLRRIWHRELFLLAIREQARPVEQWSKGQIRQKKTKGEAPRVDETESAPLITGRHADR